MPKQKNLCNTAAIQGDNLESTYDQVRPFGRKTEEEKLQQIVYVNYQFDEIVYLLDVISSVHDNVIANQIICNVL